ncbi:hypothetical protein C8R46DRAFT_1048222 [Mycena filopes]|nr:hypothetical protein C8R46DRAFT_1048222 [Mycena filopes]
MPWGRLMTQPGIEPAVGAAKTWQQSNHDPAWNRSKNPRRTAMRILKSMRCVETDLSGENINFPSAYDPPWNRTRNARSTFDDLEVNAAARRSNVGVGAVKKLGRIVTMTQPGIEPGLNPCWPMIIGKEQVSAGALATRPLSLHSILNPINPNGLEAEAARGGPTQAVGPAKKAEKSGRTQMVVQQKNSRGESSMTQPGIEPGLNDRQIPKINAMKSMRVRHSSLLGLIPCQNTLREVLTFWSGKMAPDGTYMTQPGIEPGMPAAALAILKSMRVRDLSPPGLFHFTPPPTQSTRMNEPEAAPCGRAQG